MHEVSTSSRANSYASLWQAVAKKLKYHEAEACGVLSV